MEEVSLLGSLFVNGKYIENSSSGVLEPSEDGNGRESLIGYNLGRHFKKEDMDVELILEDASHTLDGNWKFEFHANGEQLSEQTQEIATDIHYSLPDGTPEQPFLCRNQRSQQNSIFIHTPMCFLQ